VKRKKSVGSHSDLNETGIFVFLTLVIFFVAVGFPTLINTSPTLGYEGIDWTPVSTMYQEAYAYEEAMETIAFSNFNPIVISAFLVMPTAIDNPPPDPAQYFELKYGQPITIEQGFVETVRPEMTMLVDVNLIFNMGIPMSWQEFYYLVEKSSLPENLIGENIENDFAPNPLIPSAYGDSIYVQPSASSRYSNDQSGTGTVCLTSGAYPVGGVDATAGADVQHLGSSSSGRCFFTVFTFNPQIPQDHLEQFG